MLGNRHCLFLSIVLSIVFLYLPSHAEEFLIPDVVSKVSDAFIIESIGKLDDFVEDIRRKEELRDAENVGFANAALVHLGTMTGALLDQFFFKTKIVTPVFTSIDDMTTIGKAGSLPMKLGNFVRKWMVTASLVQSVKSAPEKTFVVHVKDLPIFRKILLEIRDQEVSILLKLWRRKSVSKDAILNLEKTILENRPSYRKVFDSCSIDPTQYKINTAIDLYRTSFFDYIKVLTLSPGLITSQYNAGMISPSVRAYIKQETLPFALKKCFRVKPSAFGIFQDESDRFIAQLLAVDSASKFVIIATVYSVWKFKNKPKAPSPGALMTIRASMFGNMLRPVLDVLAKISPTLIAKVLIGSQIAASIYSLYTIKQEYNSAKDDSIQRRSSEEFKNITKKLFHSRASEHLKKLNELLSKKDLDQVEKNMIEQEITNWSVLEAEFRT